MRRDIQKALLIHPPGPLVLRGEDRCQASVSDSAAVSLRPPNDLAYMAAVLRRIGVEPHIVDYPAERLDWEALRQHLTERRPDLFVASLTTETVMEDLQAFRLARAVDPCIRTVGKGALFFACDLAWLDRPEFDTMEFALVGESETVVADLVAALENGQSARTVPGVLYRDGGRWQRSGYREFETDLDELPFPARDLLRNELYVRPDTGEPQATVQTSRGCPSRCIFCLTPAISGSRVRYRSAANVVDELEECVNVYGIRNFFFKADTFTMNRNFVMDLCGEILRRGLDIAWVANSRVDTIDEERLQWMKRAGCWLVAFGFESGSDEMLRRMKKDATVADAYRAVRLTRAAGLRIYGFFMIGLPWDTHETVQETLSFARKLDCDFAEIHLATPYEGTELHTIVRETGLLHEDLAGHNYFSNPAVGTMFLSREELLEYRRAGIRRLYMNPRYVARTLRSIHSPREFKNYAAYSLRLVRNLLTPLR